MPPDQLRGAALGCGRHDCARRREPTASGGLGDVPQRLIPVAGIGIDGYILYKGFFVTELALPFKTGSSIVWISVAWALIGIVWALSWYNRRRLSAISLPTEV